MYGWTGGNQDIQNWNLNVRSDEEVLGLIHLNASNPTGANYQVRVMARAQPDTRNGYAARVIHAPTGAVSWSLGRVDNAGGTGTVSLGSGTLLASGGAGTTWWVRLRTQGTTISARFWRDGTAEPTGWTVTTTDSYWASGRAGFGAYVSTGITSVPVIGMATFSAID